MPTTPKPVADLLAKELIPPKNDEVRNSLAWLQWIVWEALGLCWVMSATKRYTTSEIVAAHLYAQGATIPEAKRLKPPASDLREMVGCVASTWFTLTLYHLPHHVPTIMRQLQ